MYRILTMSLLMTLGLSFSAYAGTWEQRGSDWYYLDASGNPTVGRFYDEAGDIYCADSSGRCQTGDVNSDLGLHYYGNDCKLRTISTGDNFEELAIKFCNGEEIYLKTGSDHFEMYYEKQVTFGTQNAFIEHRSAGDGGSFLINPEPVDRDVLIGMLMSRVGAISGNTVDEKVADATTKVANAFYYNELVNTTLAQTITEGGGVCWNFARALEEVLQHEGIHAEVVNGFAWTRGFFDTHTWVRTWAGDHWIYSDPTFLSGTGNALYANIPYDVYLRDYRMIKY